MKNNFLLLLISFLIGLLIGWYFTSNNFLRQFNCYDLGNFHNDYLNKNFPNLDSEKKSKLNQKLRELCFTDPIDGEVNYGNPE
jgi:hypothetical protein